MISPKTHKKDGTLRKEYKDLPRFQVILGYESDFQKKFDANIKAMVNEVVNTAQQMIKK